MAKRRRSKRRRVNGAVYSAVGKPRKRSRKRRMNGSVYASVGKRRKGKRRRSMGSPMGETIKDFAMILLGGGIGKIGSDMVNPMLYGMARGPLVPALLKGATGAFLYNEGKKGNKLITGLGIGIAVSGLEDVGRALSLPWLPWLPKLTADKDGKYAYSSLGAPAKDLFVVLPEHKQVSGPDDHEMGEVPVIGDVPVIGSEEGMGEVPVIGGY